MKLLPVALNVAGRRCAIFGGGSVAFRKAESLIECGAHVIAIAPQFGAEWSAIAVERIERVYQPGDCASAALVFACTNDPAINRQIAEEAREAQIWCNLADDAATSNFHSMALLRRGEITIGIATGGGSPALSRHLKSKVSETIGPEYDSLLQLLSARRENLSQTLTSQSERAEFWRAILLGPVLELLRERKVIEAEQWIDTLLTSAR